MMKKILSCFLCIIIFLTALILPCNAYNLTAGETENIILSAIEGRRINDALGGSILAGEKFTSAENGGSSSASSTFSDWLAFTIGRFSYVYTDDTVDYLYDGAGDRDAYISALEKYVSSAYIKNSGKLSKIKATEYSRLALCLTSLGGNAESFSEYNGNKINLIADGSYNCLVSSGPSRQGINGVIFALLCENIKDYDIPDDCRYTQDYMIEYILARQKHDGGWALNGDNSDVDITAMALQALSFYYESDREYSYMNIQLGENTVKSVRTAADEALAFLSAAQLEDGDYSSWGTVNSESTAQTLIAVLSLGINPLTDSRFIKNSHTLIDGILKYRLSDGTFTHSYSVDAENPSAVAGKYNYMATDQSAMAMVAYWRYLNGINSLYDMRPDCENPEKIGTAISGLWDMIREFIIIIKNMLFGLAAGGTE